MNEKSVKLFTLSTCSHCKAAKQFLDECTVQYNSTDVDKLTGDERRAVIEDLKGFNPKCSVPTIIIGEEVIIGFDEDAIKNALGLS
jgi:glutaredoxin-like protein NrdH